MEIKKKPISSLNFVQPLKRVDDTLVSYSIYTSHKLFL